MNWRRHDHLEPTLSVLFSEPPDDEHPFYWEDLECARCAEPVGECWIGGNDDGSDATEFFPFWRDHHPGGSNRDPRDPWLGYYDVFCPKCHDELTAPLPPIPNRVVGEPEDWQPLVGGWVIAHTRGTDVVYFGPFATLPEADRWMREVGADRGVAGGYIPLVSPASNPANLWHDPVRDGQVQIVQPETVDTNA